MIDKETQEILEAAADLVTIGEGLIQLGGYLTAKVEKLKKPPTKPKRKRRKRSRK